LFLTGEKNIVQELDSIPTCIEKQNSIKQIKLKVVSEVKNESTTVDLRYHKV